jgi:hypothetical protein
MLTLSPLLNAGVLCPISTYDHTITETNEKPTSRASEETDTVTPLIAPKFEGQNGLSCCCYRTISILRTVEVNDMYLKASEVCGCCRLDGC